MIKWSANLGFLWTDRTLPDAIKAASQAGFDAVECHWPYEHDPLIITKTLSQTGLPMLVLNTKRGDMSKGESQAAKQTLQANLAYAAKRAEQAGKTILIEPLNHRDVPSYHLQSVEAAARTIDAVGSDRVKIMFDFYHIQILQGDLLNRFKAYLPYIGHVQIAGVPQRAEPDRGEVNYPALLPAIYEAGYDGYVGAEYKPVADTDSGLGWRAAY